MVGEADFREAQGNGAGSVFAGFAGRMTAERRMQVIIGRPLHGVECWELRVECRIKKRRVRPALESMLQLAPPMPAKAVSMQSKVVQRVRSGT